MAKAAVQVATRGDEAEWAALLPPDQMAIVSVRNAARKQNTPPVNPATSKNAPIAAH